MKTPLLVAAALVTLFAFPARAQESPCLRVGDILNWNAPDDKTLIAEDHAHQKFKLKLMGSCTDLKFHNALAFKAHGGQAISCLAPGDYVLQSGFPADPSRCSIT